MKSVAQFPRPNLESIRILGSLTRRGTAAHLQAVFQVGLRTLLLFSIGNPEMLGKNSNPYRQQRLKRLRLLYRGTADGYGGQRGAGAPFSI